MKIIIVESPSKSKTIEGYMGKDYKVLSSKGHIRDLATSGPGGLGIDIEHDFTPTYVIDKRKADVVKELQAACQNATVFLATDPDREGEAISWHLAKVLGLNINENNRVVFHEITKNAVREAFDNPRKIDVELVESQETRRILDRIIGFKLSHLLKNKISAESAGRVQSATLKLIVDLEKEIEAFVPNEYWTIEAAFDGFKAVAEKYQNKKLTISNKEEAQKYLNILGKEYTVSQIDVKLYNKDSKPPYITSTLQQDASARLGFDPTKTMRLAQALYEGKQVGEEMVGLITYMRTDSDRLSDVFINETKKYIIDNYGEKYLGKMKHKNTTYSQDAHEAIRPTSTGRTPSMMEKYLTKDELKLYTLIYERAIASIMASAVNESTVLSLMNNEVLFKASGNRIVFDGYTRLIKENKEDVLPALKENDVLYAKSIKNLQHFTQPPARYTEARLIKEMEDSGIGRPSTYAQTVQTLKKRKYITLEAKKIHPSELGALTIEKLDEFFEDIINVSYTANMEKDLDLVASDNEEGKTIVRNFYKEFEPMLEKAKKDMEKVVAYTGNFCPECGSPLVNKRGPFGNFEACSAYPKCKFKVTKELLSDNEVVDSGIKCPNCHEGTMVLRIAKNGKNRGKEFYGCSNFPKCKTALYGKPDGTLCPKCNSLMIETPNGMVCSNNACQKR